MCRFLPHLLLAIAVVSSAAPLPKLWTTYYGRDEATGLSWQGMATIDTATGVVSKQCNLVFSDSGTPPYYGASLLSPTSNSDLYAAYGTYGGPSTSVKKISLGSVPLPKCITMPAFPLSSGGLQNVTQLLSDPVTNATYLLALDLIYQIDLASGSSKLIANFGFGLYSYPYAVAVANGTLVAWFGDGDQNSFKSSTVTVIDFVTNKTTQAKFSPLNGVSLMSAVFTYYQGSWLGLSTNPWPFPHAGNSSSYLLQFDPVHLTLKQVSNTPILELDTRYENLLNYVAGPVLQPGTGYLYALESTAGPLLIYDLSKQALVSEVALSLGSLEMSELDTLYL